MRHSAPLALLRLAATTLVVSALGCASADDDPVSERPAGCRWYQTCGLSPSGDGNCGSCDDGDPCTRDACVGLRCVSLPTSDACTCTASCGAEGLHVVQTVKQGDGGAAGLEEVRGLTATADGRHAYVAASASGRVTLVDLTVDPPVAAASWDAGAVTAVALVGDETLLVAGATDRITVFSRDTQTGALSVIGQIPMGATGFAVSGRKVAALDGKSLLILDLSNPQAPSLSASRALSEAAGARAAVFVGRFLVIAGFDTSRLLSIDTEAVGLPIGGGVTDAPGLTRPDAVARLDDEHVLVAGFCDNSVAVIRVDPRKGALSWVSAYDARVGATLITDGPTEGCPSSDDGTTFIHPGAVAAAADGKTVAVMHGARRNFAYERFEWTGTALEWRASLLDQPPNFDGSGVDYVTDPKPALVPFDPMKLRGFVSLVATQAGFVASSAISNAVTRITAAGYPTPTTPPDRAIGFARRGAGGADGLVCAVGAALPPDGRHLYTSPRCVPHVGRLAVDPVRGTLEPQGAFIVPSASPDDSVGAVTAPTNTLVAVVSASPSLAESGRIVAFKRDPEDGGLVTAGLMPFATCGDERAFPVGIIGSPDGKDLYAADFHRQGPSCIQHGHLQDNGKWALQPAVVSEAVGGVEAFTFTKDGRHLYAGCYVAGGTTVLSRDAATGALTLVGTYTRPETYGAEYAALSPDERFVYVASPIESTLSTWARDVDTGAITWLQTIHASTEIPIGAAAGPTTSPEGDLLYVASHTDDTLTAFAIGSDGLLTLSSVVRDAFDWPNWIIASPDGHHVYVAAVKSSSVTVLRRQKPGQDGCLGTACPR